MSKHSRLTIGEVAVRVITVGFIILFLAILLLPVAWVVITSLKTIPEAYEWPPTLWPREATFEAYIQVWKYKNFSENTC